MIEKGDEKKPTKKYVTISNIFGETFNLYFKNIIKLATPGLILFVPFFFLFIRFFFNIMNEEVLNNNDFLPNPLPFYSAYFFFILGLYFLYLLLFRISSNFYLEREETLYEVFSLSLKRALFYFCLLILMGLGVLVGTYLLIIPGIMLFYMWILSIPVFIEEKLGITESLKRSRQLMKGYKFKLFLTLLLLVILIYAILFVVMILVGLVGAGFYTRLMSGKIHDFPMVLQVILALVISCIYSAILPFGTLFLTVYYFNIRKEKEGFATENLADDFMGSSE